MSALDNIAKISTGRKAAAAVVLLAVFGTVYYFARYQTLSNDFAMEERQSRTLRNQEGELEQKRASYEADVRRLAQLREHFAKQSRILPPEAQMSSFLDSLNNHAELVGLEIALVQPLDEEPMGFYAKIPVELHLRGRYHELSKFFFEVGQLERIINIENIDLEVGEASQAEAAEGGSRDVLINAKVLATTFRALAEDEGEEEGG